MGRASCVVACLIMLACEPGAITLTDPESSSSTIPEPKLTIEVTLDPLDQALGDSLGWNGGVPGATVYLLRNGTATWDTLVTDSLGVAERTVLPGLYRIYAERVLTTTEAAKVGVVVRAFGDGRTVPIGRETTVSLQLLADRPGGLVISEIGTGTAVSWEVGGSSYFASMHFEIYNNGPTTAYLDGMLFGQGYSFHREIAGTPCSVSEPIRMDSLGIHTREALQFPGTGMEFPVPPGATRLIAVSAIDHRPVHPLLLDLSHADFEIANSGSADNPAVPNLIDVSFEQWFNQSLLGHDVLYLARPVDLGSLPGSVRDTRGKQYVRLPREHLIDVIITVPLWPDRDPLYPPCGLSIHRDFDRYEGGFKEIGFDIDFAFGTVRGYQRRALRRAPNGRIILFNTNTSAVDFEWVIKTPGWVPEPNP